MYMKKIVRLTESDLARIVRRVINEQETSGTTVVVNGPEVIPQDLVDNKPPKGTYYSGGRQGWFSIVDESKNVTYKFPGDTTKGTFNHGISGRIGFVEAMTNQYFFTDPKYIAKFKRGTVPASEIVANTNDKWIGFSSDDVDLKFACFKNISNEFICEEYGWYNPPK